MDTACKQHAGNADQRTRDAPPETQPSQEDSQSLSDQSGPHINYW
jgi:hypothetical protein